MNLTLKMWLTIFGVIASACSFSQSKDSSYIGTVKGVTKDSANNYALQSATVSIYMVEDSSLLGYQLSDNSGKFRFEKMPVGQPLQVVVSFGGYKNFKKTFTIPADKKEMDLENLNLSMQNEMMDEVVIEYVPPVRMKGDTLEFNADAFKLEKNAVVEDLLRKLPGVTVWGDGVIYVNGKEVNNLLVDGKPFMGGDSKVAIQNLPKNAIDRVQVYQQNLDEQNPLDSTTEVNIKLKADKRSGMFGKVGAGYGSRDRFDAAGGMLFYSPHTQFTIVAAGNNVNKDANSVNALVRQGSYKSRGVDVEYQPNFRAQGLSRPLSGGFNFQHDFIDKPRWRKRNRISADYFLQNNEQESLRETQTETTYTGDSSRTENNSGQNVTVSTNQTMNLRYQKETERFSLNIAPSLNWNRSDNSNVQESSSYGSKQGKQSTNHVENTGTDDRKSLNLRADFNSYWNPLRTSRIPTDFRVGYSLSTNENNGERFNKTNFVSFMDAGQNKIFDRKYNNQSKSLNQSLSFSSGDLRRLFFGYGNFGGINLRLQNNLSVNSNKQSRIVADKDTIAHSYVINKSLSNETSLNTINERPGLRLSKDFEKGLANRFSKNVNVVVNLQWQFYNQEHTSDFDFQNIARGYQKFTPEASIRYRNRQFGEYEVDYNLRYNATSEYPNINQLAPLVDSSNLYNIRRGNINLQPMDKRDFSFSMNHTSKRREAMFSYRVNISAGFIKNNIIDSSIIDASGRTTHYAVNADGSKYANADGNVNKAFKVAENQIQINLNTRFGLSKNPTYINNVMNFSDNFSNNSGLNVYYTLKDIFALNLGQNVSFSRSVQAGTSKRKFGTNTKTTTASAKYNITRNLSVSSNISYNNTSSTASEGIDFTIWNADLTYRFLKANNAEVKISGLDLLRQNISVINTVNNNTLTTGYANVLQNYFMVSLSYYPRTFGKGSRSRRGR